jgi:hypothetical protein
MHGRFDRDGSKPPIRIGSKVEYKPSGYDVRNPSPYAERDGEVVELNGTHALVRFDDGHEERFPISRLVWLPDEAEIEREAEWL